VGASEGEEMRSASWTAQALKRRLFLPCGGYGLPAPRRQLVNARLPRLGAAAPRRGILAKGGRYLEQGRLLRAVALDKTGYATHSQRAIFGGKVAVDRGRRRDQMKAIPGRESDARGG
jgi:hypothetical protein